MIGVEAPARLTGNGMDPRGSNYLLDTEDEYQIVAIGGSTTESLYLYDSEERPHLLILGLNAHKSGNPVWVTNGGQSGRDTMGHLELIRAL